MEITKLFDQISEPEALFQALMPALCQVLECDRCFLYVRDPDSRRGRITHCYSQNLSLPDLTGSTSIETAEIATLDPLMALAFQTPEPVFVEDIETAGPEVVNLDYERSAFGHRALIHVPLYWQDQLYGILEPCVFGQARVWTDADRAVTALVQEKLAPRVADYAQHTDLLFV